MTDAREVAVRVLSRVGKDGAFASLSLDTELARAGLDERDAALATTIVYGVLRTTPELDAAIKPHLLRAKKLDPLLQVILRVAVEQILHLDRIPSHAAVDAAVTFARRERGPKGAGFVNAVLRKVAAARAGNAASAATEPAPIDAATRSSAANAAANVPEWLVRELESSLGEARARVVLAKDDRAPPIDLRLREGADRDAAIARLRAAKPRAEIHACLRSPVGVRTRGAGDPRRLPGFAEGDFIVQEEGSQLIGRLVGARPGERVLDACAGRGGKTSLLAEAVGPSGHVTAIDVHDGRLAQIPGALAKLGLEVSLALETIDLSVGTGGLDATFDRVLVDAPCTGLGTLRRRPELFARVSAEDPARLGALQLAILRNAAALVKPGGVLLYSVCSPTRAEGADVVARFDVPGFVNVPFGDDARALDLAVDPDGFVRLGAFLEGADGGTDGYQIFRFSRVDRPGSGR